MALQATKKSVPICEILNTQKVFPQIAQICADRLQNVISSIDRKLLNRVSSNVVVSYQYNSYGNR